VLRDALSDLLAHATQYAPVVDGNGAVAGVLSLEVVARFLQTADPSSARTGSELAAGEPAPDQGR